MYYVSYFILLSWECDALHDAEGLGDDLVLQAAGQEVLERHHAVTVHIQHL